MNVDGTHYRSIWFDHDQQTVNIIDQRWLPHDFRVTTLKTPEEFAIAIKEMWVRGAPLIGATAAYGMAVKLADDPSDQSIDQAWELLHATRPTAINLKWALDRCRSSLKPLAPEDRAAAAMQLAHDIADEDVEINRRIGQHGLKLIQQIAANKHNNEPVRILTHCNAGWLATVDFGTATSPMYHAADADIPLHVWVDESRPRNQGALTAWELDKHGISHDYITDNAGGHLMQHGDVDIVIVGVDRATADGDICNKIGTYLKALAARDNDIPFYVALPSPTIDWTVHDGVTEIPIENRAQSEVTHIMGTSSDNRIGSVRVTPAGVTACNPAFDVTPRRLVTGLLTERGVCEPNPEALAAMFPDLKP